MCPSVISYSITVLFILLRFCHPAELIYFYSNIFHPSTIFRWFVHLNLIHTHTAHKYTHTHTYIFHFLTTQSHNRDFLTSYVPFKFVRLCTICNSIVTRLSYEGLECLIPDYDFFLNLSCCTTRYYYQDNTNKYDTGVHDNQTANSWCVSFDPVFHLNDSVYGFDLSSRSIYVSKLRKKSTYASILIQEWYSAYIRVCLFSMYGLLSRKYSNSPF